MLIAICEDTLLDMENIIDLCERYAEGKNFAVDTLMYPHADKLLADPRAEEADVVIMDIMMEDGGKPGPVGVRAARQLRAQGFAGAIVFTTTSTDYYPEGFEIGAAHYLVKPVGYADLETALDRVLFLVKKPERLISVPLNRMNVSLAQSSIRYAEVYGHETLLHTGAEPLRVLLPLSKIEKLLDGESFLRCYRSYIINMDYVTSIAEDHFVLQGDVKIPLSLRNRHALREKYFAYRLMKLSKA